MFLTQHATARIVAHGTDSLGLGRWTWIKLAGRRGITTRIITGYHPVRDTSNRPGSVFSQHEKYFYDSGQPRDPRTAFLSDLETELRQWLADGDQIILGMDVNENIYNDNIHNWTSSLGLVSPLRRTHPTLPDVATCDKGNRDIPIDGIWITPGLDVTQCGMTGFGEIHIGSSDHRLLWIDISYETVFGFQAPVITPRPKHFFPIHDPLAVTRYNNSLRKNRLRYHIPTQLDTLHNKALAGTFGARDIQTYDAVCKQDDALRQQARKQSRRFFAGQVLYSDVIGNDYKGTTNVAPGVEAAYGLPN
jgi:hypothetical protein